jgi:hypothetical protein
VCATFLSNPRLKTMQLSPFCNEAHLSAFLSSAASPAVPRSLYKIASMIAAGQNLCPTLAMRHARPEFRSRELATEATRELLLQPFVLQMICLPHNAIPVILLDYRTCSVSAMRPSWIETQVFFICSFYHSIIMSNSLMRSIPCSFIVPYSLKRLVLIGSSFCFLLNML